VADIPAGNFFLRGCVEALALFELVGGRARHVVLDDLWRFALWARTAGAWAASAGPTEAERADAAVSEIFVTFPRYSSHDETIVGSMKGPRGYTPSEKIDSYQRVCRWCILKWFGGSVISNRLAFPVMAGLFPPTGDTGDGQCPRRRAGIRRR
jgi:hypothetical protein